MLFNRNTLFKSVLLLLASIVAAGVGYLAFKKLQNGCQTVKSSTVFQSPDRRYEVQQTEETCSPLSDDGGKTYSLILRRTNSTNPGTTVFVTQTAAPEVIWTDASHLTVSITHIMDIVLSVHSVDGIAISYRLSETLSKKMQSIFGPNWWRSVGPTLQH